MEYALLQIKFPDGHVLYLINLISFVFIIAFMAYVSIMFNAKKYDKVLHVSISLVLTIISLLVCSWLKIGWWWGPCAVALIGVLKEVYDKLFKKTHLFDPKDLLADAFGVIPVTAFYIFSFLLYTPM